MPQPGTDGRQHHQAHRHQRSQGLESGNQIDHHQHQKALLPDPATAQPSSLRIQKGRVKAIEHQAAVHTGQCQQADRANPCHQVQALAVHAQGTAEKNVQQVQLRTTA